MQIHSKESKSADIHGVICETTKLASNLTSNFCNFKVHGGLKQHGTFSFMPTNMSEEVKCFQLVQTRF